MKRTIAHLSDLHFGAVDPATLTPLIAAIEAARPDLVVVSGDLTQRARRKEFEQARDFLARLPVPQVVVPGNHDVPLHNPWLRFVSKWARFERHHGGLEQTFQDEELVVAGINTARAFAWKGGRVGAQQMESVRAFFEAAPAKALKVVVAHHPLDIPRGWQRANRAMRSRKALGLWEGCGVDLILAGHAHRAWAGKAHKLTIGNHKALVVQAGTATSTRGRGEPNSFNLIEVTEEWIEVARMTWQHTTERFARSHVDRFPR